MARAAAAPGCDSEQREQHAPSGERPAHAPACGSLALRDQLRDSPGELENLRVELPGVFDRLGFLADAYEGRLTKTLPVHQETGERLSGDPEKDSQLELSPEIQAKLEDLGYAGE